MECFGADLAMTPEFRKRHKGHNSRGSFDTSKAGTQDSWWAKR